MKHELEIVVGKQIASATNLIAGIRATVAGTLEKVTVFTKGNVSSTQTFDINKGTHVGDLSTIFSNQADRPSITSGNHSDEANPTSTVTLAVGDLLTVDADVINETIELVTVIFTVEDGVNSPQGTGWTAAMRTGAQSEDDEFEGSSLNTSKWTKTGTAAAEYYNSKLASSYFMRCTGTELVTLEQAFANPGGDFQLTLNCTSLLYPSTNNNGIGFRILNSAGTDGVEILVNIFSGWKIQAYKYVSSVRTSIANGGAQSSDNTNVIQIERRSGNWYFYTIYPGFAWTAISTNQSVTFTPAKIQLFCGMHQGGNISSNSMWGGFNWFRRDWLVAA